MSLPEPPSLGTSMLAPDALAGRVAIVTGGGTGLGRAIAVELARAGSAIGIVSRDPEHRQRGVEAVEEIGGRAVDVACDVREADQVEAAFAAVAESLGPPSILINNAGIYPFMSFDDMTFEQWRQVLSINLDSMFLVTKQFLPGMRAQGWGRIVNMASAMFHAGMAGCPHYTASKGGVIGLTRALAPELGPSGITINALAPSLVRSAGTSTGFHDGAGMFDVVASMQSIRRTQMPDDLSGVMSFLVSDDARFITGQTLVVDGGLVRA